MMLERDRKALADTAVMVVIMALQKPTRNNEVNRQKPSRPSQGGGEAEGLQGVAFLYRESRPNTQPNRTHRPR